MNLEVDEFDGEPVYRVELVTPVFNLIDIASSMEGGCINEMFSPTVDRQKLAKRLNILIKNTHKNVLLFEYRINKIKIVNSSNTDKWFVINCQLAYIRRSAFKRIICEIFPRVSEYKNIIYPPKKYQTVRHNDASGDAPSYKFTPISRKTNDKLIQMQYGVLPVCAYYGVFITF